MQASIQLLEAEVHSTAGPKAWHLDREVSATSKPKLRRKARDSIQEEQHYKIKAESMVTRSYWVEVKDNFRVLSYLDTFDY